MGNSFKRVLIASDLSETDDLLMSFVQQLSKQMKIEKVYLSHIIPNILVPAGSEVEFHKLFTAGYPLDEKVRDVLVGKSLDYFDQKEIDVEVEVVEGKAYTKLLETIKEKEIDLLVVGNKSQSEGSGITARRIARKVGCSVLFVPQTPVKKINRVLVPIDFSDYSGNALKTALELGKNQWEVSAMHVVNLLRSDQYYGITLNPEFRQTMVDKAWEAFHDFQKKMGLPDADFEKEVVINNFTNVAAQIKNYLKDKDYDLIVIGARGHSVFESFLLGSVAETFVNTFVEKPILIIR